MALHAPYNIALGPYTAGEQTDPADDFVMADSGALTHGGTYEVIVTAGASVAAQFQVQRRNTANGANVGNVPLIYALAGQSGQYRFWFTVEKSERIRVVMDDAVSGTQTAVVSLNLMHMG